MPRTTHKAATAVIESIPTASGTSLVVNVYRPSLVRRLLGLVWRLVGLGLRLFGLGLTATGAAHFAVPERFDKLTALAFPTDTRQWTLRNGCRAWGQGRPYRRVMMA
ncbi:MAG: hypothetical protein HOQ24_06070 [Mycobacteriaceae bacterium]|nr:hypothetical protein [Mycobacteriaceae bacterium]